MSLSLTVNLDDPVIGCIGEGLRLQAKARICSEQGADIIWYGHEAMPEDAPDGGRLEALPESLTDAFPVSLLLVETGDPEDDIKWIERAGPRVMVWSPTRHPMARVQFPATINRGPLRISVDTAGRWPTVANWFRQKLDTLLPQGIASTLEAMVSQGDLKAKLTTPHQRRTFWYGLLDGPLVNRAHQMADDEIHGEIQARIDAAAAGRSEGEVYLVGAGPGDPDLLTVKALRVIAQADVVLYDRLVSKEILARVRADAEMIHVGKQRSNHTVPQDQINQRLVDLAKEGRTVVRLKGGDPFIFGRGGEEIESLAEAGLKFQVVPGITAASGCSAYAGIPLTHRDYAQSVRFVTGHLKNNTCDLPWNDFVQSNQTLVFYMGLVGLPVIASELIKHGMPADMPVALVSKGTTPEQTVVTGSLESIAGVVERSEVRAPTLIIVGEVVKLRGKLDWLNR